MPCLGFKKIKSVWESSVDWLPLRDNHNFILLIHIQYSEDSHLDALSVVTKLIQTHNGVGREPGRVMKKIHAGKKEGEERERRIG